VGWGIGWALLIVAVIVALITYVIVQEMRAQQYWRRLVEQGDLDAIRRVVQSEVERWREDRPPSDVPVSLWRGVQTVELLEVGRDYLRLTCTAEGQYAMLDGQRREVSTALSEGMKLTAKLADMFLYDIPNLRLDRVQIDVYTAFRDRRGAATQDCILSTLVRRSDAQRVDWEGFSPEEIVAAFGGRFRRDHGGAALPIEPDAETVRVGPAAAQSPQSEA
jgi:hypothetical protein